MAKKEPVEGTPGEMVPAVSEVEDVAALRKALEEETARAEANLAGWQRAQADFINYKRRTEQEKEEIGQFAKAELILNLLPVLDDTERAFEAIPGAFALDGWVEGIGLVWRKLRSVLEAQGVSEVKALGEPFDPNYHEAVMPGKGKEGMVVGEIKKGYMLNGRVIRPSAVVVGSGEGEAKGLKEAEEGDKKGGLK